MKQIRLILLAAILMHCNSKPETTSTNTPTGASTTNNNIVVHPVENAYIFFSLDSLKNAIATGAQRTVPAMLARYTKPGMAAKSFDQFDGEDPTGIPCAVQYIQKHPAPAESPVYDTLFEQFTKLYYRTASHFEDIMNMPANYAALNGRQDNPNDAPTKNILAYLALYSMDVYMTEGIYYADAAPAFFSSVFHAKGSPGLRDFLTIQKQEMKEGFSEDAGLIITYPQLYQRVEAWAKFMHNHPQHLLTDDALDRYRTYLSTLITGMDNTPVFEYEPHALNEEAKALYEDIIKNGTDPLAKKIITEYYQYLSKDSFRYNDSVTTFLDRYDLETLQAAGTHKE